MATYTKSEAFEELIQFCGGDFYTEIYNDCLSIIGGWNIIDPKKHLIEEYRTFELAKYTEEEKKVTSQVKNGTELSIAAPEGVSEDRKTGDLVKGDEITDTLKEPVVDESLEGVPV